MHPSIYFGKESVRNLVALQTGQTIRFIVSSRFNDWQKGDFGEVTKVLALPPQNQKELYIIKVRDNEVWATSEDVIAFNQMRLF